MRLINIVLGLVGLAILGKLAVDSQSMLLPMMGYAVVGAVALVIVGVLLGQRHK